jgi:hypothetical protein
MHSTTVEDDALDIIMVQIDKSSDSTHAKGIFTIILDLIANIDIAVIMFMLTWLYVQERDNRTKNYHRRICGT